MIEMGFLMKRRRPLMPAYLLRQPADHSRTTYSEPKNSTSTISCRATEHNMRDWEPARDTRGCGMKTWAAWEHEEENEGLFLEKKKKKKKRKKSRDQTGPGHVAKDSLPYKRVMTGWACEVVGQEPRSPTWKDGGWLGHRWQLTLGAGQRSSEWRWRRRPPKPIGRPNNQCGCHR